MRESAAANSLTGLFDKKGLYSNSLLTTAPGKVHCLFACKFFKQFEVQTDELKYIKLYFIRLQYTSICIIQKVMATAFTYTSFYS